ncbi:hypothetical protein CGZ80_19125 [Rhodopirellula sp. MGV]|nr:hypothetical protein CGZ80_19125 [Rhodopirellula sp. MGV]
MRLSCECKEGSKNRTSGLRTNVDQRFGSLGEKVLPDLTDQANAYRCHDGCNDASNDRTHRSFAWDAPSNDGKRQWYAKNKVGRQIRT